MGQAPQPQNYLIPMSKTDIQGINPVKRSTPYSGWYNNIGEAQTTGLINYTLYNNTLFADSQVQVLYGTSTPGVTQLGYVFTQGVGEVFDPKSLIYTTPLSNYNTYNVDSVELPYLYNYVYDSTAAPDTLIFQFYTLKSGGITAGLFQAQPPQFPNKELYAYTKYNPSKNLGSVSVGTTTYIMGAKDSQSTVKNAIAVATNGLNGIDVNQVSKTTGFNTDLFAYTVSYRPGFSYKLGDTIDEKNNPLPKKLHSHFKILIGNDQSKPSNSDYEMSLAVTTATRYNLAKYRGNTNGWLGLYVPGSAYFSYNQVLWSLFHLSTPNLGIETSGAMKGYDMGVVYPNPSHGNTSLEFSVGKTEKVTIKVYDIVGHEVATLANNVFTEGSHTINFNTSNFKTGLYLYSITAGNYSKTMKFTVSE
jgi:hypothetical protein